MTISSVENLESTTFGGRRFTRKQITGIQQTVKTFTALSRRELAHTVCEHLQWQTPNGKNKIQSCLGMFEKLEDLGILSLPPKNTSMQRGSQKQIPRTDLAKKQADIDDKLDQLTPISLQVATGKDDIALWNEYIDRYHYLAYKRPIGPHIRYFIVDHQHRKLGCLMFSYASKVLLCRDEWIGWQDKTYKKHLDLVLNNNRFLILPWVSVKNLASKVLSIAARQLADDWQSLHGYRPVLLETFIDTTKFNASSYRAANWLYLGKTQVHARKTTKAVYVYPLQKKAKDILINGHPPPIKKRTTRSEKIIHSNDPFIQLWQNIIGTVTSVTNDFDAQWQKRKRTLNTLLLVLFIFRLVFSKNRQGYAITIAELWDQCRTLGISLPQSTPVAASAFCAARSKMDEQVFTLLHREILKHYNKPNRQYLWNGHDVFAVDGSKMNLPRPLMKQGYRIPSDNAHYPQGLLSCLYQLKSKIPIDFDLVSHGDERKLALSHLAFVSENAVIVYDRGYFSYALLDEHVKQGIHPVFRLKNKANKIIDAFIASDEKDKVVDIPNPEARKKRMDRQAKRLRLNKYTVSGTNYILGTTLLDSQKYPIEDLSDLYHSRWGVEELYKISKQLMSIEEFHAQSARGVKQELFAHFILITLTRIFSNHSEEQLNSPNRSEAKETKTNFKNALVTVARNIEDLLLQQATLISKTVNHIMASISWRRQKERPNRSYARRSRKPVGKWLPTKTTRKEQHITA